MYFDDNGNSRFNLFAYMMLSRKASENIHEHVREALHNENDLLGKDDPLDSSLILDSSNTNYKWEMLQRIRKFIPNPRVIFSMRDPVEREFSNFRFSAQLVHKKDDPLIRDQTPEGFDRYVQQMLNLPTEKQFPQTQYPLHVQNILQTFPRDKVGFVKFEEYVQDPIAVLERDVLPVFGTGPFSEAVKESINKDSLKTNQSLRKYKMLNSTRKILQEHFSQSNRKVSELLNDSRWNWGY